MAQLRSISNEIYAAAGLTSVTIAQQDQIQCVKEDNPLKDEKACPNNWICPSNETCGNSTMCRCRKGYFQCLKAGVVLCADINECITGIHVCGNNAFCKNMMGGYYCTCSAGYQKGNQTAFCPSKDEKQNECTDIDECTDLQSICGSNSICKNTRGSYVCICDKGFTYISDTCKDIDECTDVPGICGSNIICNNTLGSYQCICDNRFANISDTCEDAQFQDPNTSEPQSSSRGQHQNTVCSMLQETFANFNVSCHSNVKLTTKEAKNQLENDTKILNNMLEEYNTLSTPDSLHTGKTTTTILKNVEIFVMKSFIDAPRNQTIITPQLAISMEVSSHLCTSVDLFFRLMLNDNLMDVPCDQLDRDTDGGVFIVYKDLHSSLNGNILKSSQISEDDDDTAIVGSRVVTGAITKTLTSQVTFTFAHIRVLKYSHNPVCVFWDPIKNGWSTDGCTTKSSESNDTHTTCSCNHLSSFAVIMAPLGFEDNHALTILSYFGLILSVLCLALTLLTFVLCHTLRSTHTSVLTALCSCLFLGQVLFLVGVNQTSNKILCSVIAGGLHFLFLCAFCWMSIESVILFMTVRNLRAVNYMTSHWLKFPMMSLLGFGIPTLTVGISAAIDTDGYGTNEYCWLRSDSTIWGFLGPVAVFIVMNTALLVFTIILLRKRLTTINTNVSTLKNSRSLTFKALAQFFILGCTWGIGFFQFRNGSVVISYIFTICNSLQGVYIFLVHCVFNYQVRQEYKELFCKARKRGKLSMDDSTPNNVTNHYQLPSVTLSEISKPVSSEKTTAKTKIDWTQD